MIKPYGSWDSPITSDLITSSSVRLGNIRIDGENTYWIESCPDEGGRNTIKKYSASGDQKSMLETPFNVRSGVHEYGGGEFIVHEGNVYFSNIKDHQIYLLGNSKAPVQLTHEENTRFCGFYSRFSSQEIVHGSGKS